MKSRLFAITLPVILLTSFVVLSGWHPGPTDKDPQDTTKKSNKKSASYSKKTIITFDENGEPHEQTIESFDGDEGLRKLIVPNHDFDFDIPAIPDFDFGVPGFPQDFSFHMGPDFQLDSLDALRFHLSQRDFDGFGEEMDALMKQKFEALGPQFEESMKQLEDQLRHMDMSLDMQFEGMDKDLEEQLQHLEHDLGDLDLDLRGLNENLKNLDEDLKHMDEDIKAFEKDAQEELVKDGYLEQDEKIESIEWTDETIKFNNKEIKPKHLDKYRKLKSKHIKHQWHRGRPE